MTDPRAGLSRETFERLIARAVEIDERGEERIDLQRAREIAREVGVSESAWNAALRERNVAPGTRSYSPRRADLITRFIPAAAGLVAGAVLGTVSAASDGNDVISGALLIVASMTFAVRGVLRDSYTSAQQGLAAWWLAAPAGIALGLGHFSTDALWFAGFSWLGCATVTEALSRVVRRSRTPLPIGSTPAG